MKLQQLPLFRSKRLYSQTAILKALQPPSYMDGFEDQYIQTIWYIFTVGGAACLYLAIFFGIRQFWLHSIISTIMTIAVGISLVLIKRGQVHLCTSIVFSLAYVAALAGVLFERGINDIGVQAIYPIFFLIGAFMHRRAAIFFGILTLLWIIGLIYLDSIGFYLERPNRYDPITKGLITGCVFVLTALVMRYTIQKTLLVNKELNIAKREAEQASRLKSLFLTNMSHELRTPLNAIIGYSEGVLEEHEMMQNLDDETAEDIHRIRVSGKHLLTLINDILDLAKIEADKMEVVFTSFNLCQLINEVFNIVEPIAEKNNTHVRYLNNCNDLLITSDRQKIKQTLLNLLSNAAKYTQNGKVTILVSKVEPAGVRISIADTGIGIAKDDLPYIFDSFKQVDSSLSRSFAGTGLGLAITKRMVDVLQGDLLVESEEGKGSIFTLILPTEGVQKEPRTEINSNHESKIFEPFV